MTDQVANAIKVNISGGYDATATSITLVTGEGAELPDPSGDEYNLVWWNSTAYPDPADDPNFEIVRATGLSGDVLTVTRNQETSGASTKNTASSEYKMIMGPTAKTITDLQAEIDADIAAHAAIAVMDADIPDQSFTNIIENGDFESWSAGTSSDPDGWASAGVATVAREGTIKKMGNYSLKLTSGGAYTNIKQFISDYVRYQSRTVTLGCWVYAASGMHTRLNLYDGVSHTPSSDYSGSSSWEWMTVTKTLDATVGQLCVTLYANYQVTGGDAYFDGIILVEGTICPAFSPKPIVDDGVMLHVKTPSAANAAGIQGQICTNATYIYVCTATNTWKRSALSSW